MRFKLLLLSFLFWTTWVYGQLNEKFESEQFPPNGWVVEHLLEVDGNQNGWSRKGQPFIACPNGGDYVAYSLSGRSFKDTDSWLITPEVQVKAGDFLNFYLKVGGADGGTLTTFEVLISETGNAKDNFETRLLQIVPRSEMEWSQYSVDLSAYAGKKVYIAFHDQLLAPTSYVQGCNIYLDNVEISQKSSSDLSLSSILSPRNDCSPIQYVQLQVNNTGKEINEFTACYQLNSGEIVREVFNRRISTNEKVQIELKKPVELQPDVSYFFKAWVESTVDDNALNDALTTSVRVGSQIPFPYFMNESATVNKDFVSYGMMAIWACQQTALTPKEAWIYSGGSAGAVLGSNCMALPKGRVRVSFNYLVSQHAVLKIYCTNNPGWGNYKDSIGVSPMLYGDNEFHPVSFTIEVPEEGMQSLGFTVNAPNGGEFASVNSGSASVLFLMDNLVIEDASEDVAVEEFITPVSNIFSTATEDIPITVLLRNLGSKAQSGFTMNYQLNDGAVVSENFVGSLPAGTTMNYEFKKKVNFTSAGEYGLKVWIDVSGDTQEDNNLIKKSLSVCKVQNMPYKMGFEADEDINGWDILNMNRDAVKWACGDGGMKGDKAFRLPYIENLPNDDYLVSPAIHLPKGKARISFFYALTGGGSLKFEVLMSKSKEPGASNKVLFSQSASTDGWTSGFAPIEVEEEGDYYFVIHGKGLNSEILLDEISIDTDIDVCMDRIEFIEKGNYNLTKSDVRIAFSNNSAQSVRKVKVSYQLNNEEIVSETINEEIQPGSVYTYTFKQPADISVCRTHVLLGMVEVKDDVESLNNTMSTRLEHYKNKQLPYFQNFDDRTVRVRWTNTVKDLNEDGNSWIAAGNASYDAYSQTTCLYYESYYPGNDWIFSECIEIPAGTFDFSFFYRTAKNWSDRKENFKIMLGTSPNPEDMTITIADFRETFVSDPEHHQKVLKQFTMEEPGKYYIGVYTDSPASGGMIVIDDILIEKPETKEPFYQSDFTNRYNEWTAYKLAPIMFDQWTKVTEEGSLNDIVQMEIIKTSKPGMFVSPVFQMEKGKTIDLELEYALITTNENDRFGLYMGTENHPDSINILVDELVPTTEWEVYKKEIVTDRDGRYVFALKPLRAGGEKGAFYKISYLKLTPAGLNSYPLKGKLVNGAGKSVAGAMVRLNGGQAFETKSDANGEFVFELVVEKQKYILEISKDKYQPYTLEIVLNGAAKDLGSVELSYEMFAPTDVAVSFNEGAETVAVNWMIPGNVVEYRYDDGVCYGQVGAAQGVASDVMGNVFRTPVALKEVSWFTTAANGIHQKVNVYILNLDAQGKPTNQILYSALDVPNLDMEWSTHKFTETVNAPNGCMVAISYNGGSLDLGIDDGIEDYPFANETCYVGSLLSGEFTPLEKIGGKSSFMVRAKGTSIQSKARVASVGEEEVLLKYLVYRLSENEEMNEEKWTLLTELPIEGTNFIDKVSGLNGIYKYAIKTVYPDNASSSAAISTSIDIKTVGIATTSLSSEILVWYVPSEKNLHVKSPAMIGRCVVYDLAGRAVWDGMVNNTHFTCFIGNLSDGKYIINLHTTNGNVIKTILKR